jgi:hypothetical protein
MNEIMTKRDRFDLCIEDFHSELSRRNFQGRVERKPD